MFDWIYNMVADMAYESAIKSADCASCNGLYQIEEPAALKNEISK